MTHYATLCPPFAGHLVPTMMIGRRLREKGHRVTLVSDERAKSMALLLGIGFLALPSIAPCPLRPAFWRGIRPIERLLQLAMRHNQCQAALRWLTDAPPLIASQGWMPSSSSSMWRLVAVLPNTWACLSRRSAAHSICGRIPATPPFYNLGILRCLDGTLEEPVGLPGLAVVYGPDFGRNQ